MARLTDAQVLNFTDEVAEIVAQSANLFVGKPVDTPGLVENLRRETREARDAEAQQIRKQADAVTATEISIIQRREAYAAAIGLVGIVEGILGKDHALVRRVRNIQDSYAQEALRGRTRSPQGA